MQIVVMDHMISYDMVGLAFGDADTHAVVIKRAKVLVDKGVDLIVIDTAHGHSEKVLRILSKVKKLNTQVPICVSFSREQHEGVLNG